MENTLPKLPILHYLISHSHGEVVAHCLDVDTVASAADEQSAIEDLNTLVKIHIEHALKNNPGNLTPAPAIYWERFLQAKFGGIGEIELSIQAPQIVPTPMARLNVLAGSWA